MFLPEPNPLPPLEGLRLHVVGIRGRGMRTVAIAAASAGAVVDGCDRAPEGAAELERHAIRVCVGHHVAHADGCHVVATTVAPPDLDELRAAAANGRAHHRSDLLAALLRDRVSIAVTGTHGKGTVTALAGLALVELGLDPTILVGLDVPELGGSLRVGSGPVVAEVDESDGSVARVPAHVAVVTNVSYDHPQYTRTVRDNVRDIARHVGGVAPEGTVVLGSGRTAAGLERGARARVWRLGRDFSARVVRAHDCGVDVRFADPEGGEVTATLRLESIRLDENAALAYAAIRALGLPPDRAANALGRLDRLGRRLERVGAADDVVVYDDYGKHPSTIAATIEYLRDRTTGSVRVVYEPHRETHIRRWRNSFGAALELADDVVVLPIADEAAPGRPLSERWFRGFDVDVRLVTTAAEATDAVVAGARPGDVVCVFGVRDRIADLASAVIGALSERSQATTTEISEVASPAPNHVTSSATRSQRSE